MTAKFLENVKTFSQRDNLHSPSNTCLHTSAAIALNYLHQIIMPYGKQIEDYIFEQIKSLSKADKQIIIDQDNGWVFALNDKGQPKHAPWTCLPIVQLVCNKLWPPVKIGWRISFDDIMENIDNNRPVVCLGDFSKISRVGGHYNCVVGYDEESKSVWTCDPWGNGHFNYESNDGSMIYYDWKIFDRGYGYSVGLLL